MRALVARLLGRVLSSNTLGIAWRTAMTREGAFDQFNRGHLR